MDSVHSYEQRSSTRLANLQEFGERQQNRIIIVDRHEPRAAWSATSFPVRSIRTIALDWLFNCFGGGAGGAGSELDGGRERRRAAAAAADADQFADSSANSSIKSTTSGNPTDVHSPSQTQTAHHDYGPFNSNELLTSKYTLFNFLPKNLFEQFRRLANFYFLTTALLQIFLPFSPVGPTTSLLPLVFVISTTAIKQAYEDYLRHKLDKEVNNRVCHVLRNKKLVKVRSKDIKVGDFVYVRNNEEIPCDMMLLATSGGDRCYVTTANLDGETNLKSRTCLHIRDQLGTIEHLDTKLLVIECDKPNATLYEFNGYLRAPKSFDSYLELVSNLNAAPAPTRRDKTNYLNVAARPRLPSISSSISSRTTVIRTIVKRIKQSRLGVSLSRVVSAGKRATGSKRSARIKSHSESIVQNMTGHHEIPLDVGNLLLRASRLRNTTYVYGLAIYTGSDTKLAKNSQVKPNKFSSTESRVNVYLCVAFAILVLFSTLGTIFYRKSRRSIMPHRITSSGSKILSAEETFVAHFLLYNYLIPISLYVTLEFIKFFGTISVVEDEKMQTSVWVSERGNQKSQLEASQVIDLQMITCQSPSPPPDEEVTATLQSLPSSQKVRILEKPKCNSSDLNEELGQVEVLFTDKTGTLTENEMSFTACSTYGHLYRFISDRLFLEPNGKRAGQLPADVTEKLSNIKSNRYAHIQHSLKHEASASTSASSSGGPEKSSSKTTTLHFNHRKPPAAGKLKLVNEMESQERLAEFFICLCLCSTITINENTELSQCLPGQLAGEYDFQTASPDEESLIKAAHLCGVTMCKSNDRECFIVIERSQKLSPPSKEIGAVAPVETRQTVATETIEEEIFEEEEVVDLPPTADEVDCKFKALVETRNSTERYIVRHFERLILFEFSSTRKRMSVVYRDCDNDCLLMVSKGSEDLLDCVKLDDSLELSDRLSINITLAHFEAFAKSGLRTLLVGRKVLTRVEYEKIVDEMKLARSMLHDRERLLNDLYKTFECQLKLIGATAVEDTLQEGVPETIENLKLAGIKVWLLTGDKVETAISVAHLSKLLDQETSLFYLIRVQDAKVCKRVMSTFRRRLNLFKRAKNAKNVEEGNNLIDGCAGKFALIVDGRSLYYAMKYQRAEFAKLCKSCQVVLGCRLSPLQKAEVVDMMKRDPEKPVTAAIGDGANDVSMIQEAHVGIGVRGKEGRQAINCSDFAINRFHLLNRLLFVHGHLFYHRTATTIQYFFYKNILFVMPQFIYSFYNLSPVLSLYHPILLICFNLFFTSLPILLYGLHETHIPELILEKYPSLYRINRNNYLMRTSLFISWLLLGALQALIGFYVLWYLFEPSSAALLLAGGMPPEMLTTNQTLLANSTQLSTTTQRSNPLGVKMYFVIILTATAKLYLASKRHSLYFNLSTLASCLLLPLVLYGYSRINWRYIIEDNSLYGQVEVYLASAMFWLAIVATTMATIVPDAIWYLRNRSLDNQRIRFTIAASGQRQPVIVEDQDKSDKNKELGRE